MRTDEVFMVGSWVVEPDRDCISRGQESKLIRPQVMKLLVYLVGLEGRVAKYDELLRDLWPSKVVTDATVYNCVAELRQALDDDVESSYIETIPKVGYRLKAQVSSAGDDGSRDRAAEHTAPRAIALRLFNSKRVIALAVITVLIAGLAATFLTDKPQDGDATGAVRSSIAILPFENRTDDSDNLYLVNGLHNELILNLGKINKLLVIAPNSVEQYRGSDKGNQEIASELGVSTILVGAVHTNGDDLRVVVRLFDGASNAQLWSDSFDAETTRVDLNALQASITRAVVAHLAATLDPEEQDRIEFKATENLEAYKAVLLGDQRLNRINVEGWRQAEAYYRQAVRLDPEYSVGWQRLADSIVSQWNTYEKSPEEFHEALAAANRAIELDSDNGLAWISKARAVSTLAVVERRSSPLQELRQMYERGIDLLPGNADASREYGLFLLGWPGQESIAIKHLAGAVRLDPLSSRNHLALGQGYRFLSRFPEALASNRRAIELQPDNPYAIWDVGLTYFEKGDLGDALIWAIKALEFERDDPSGPLITALVALDLQCFNLVNYWIARGTAIDPDTPMATSVPMSLAIYLGEHDRAADLAQRVVDEAGEERPQGLPFAQALWTLRDMDLQRGRPNAAVARYRQVFPDLASAENWNWTWPMIAIDTAFALQQAGDREAARQLLEQVRVGAIARLRVEPASSEIPWYLMEVNHLLGDDRQAEAELQRMVDRGWVSWWRYVHGRKTIDGIRDNPKLAELSTAVAERLATQRARYNLLVTERKAEKGSAASEAAGFKECIGPESML